MASGDLLLDDDGAVILDDDGNVIPSNASGDGCCCACTDCSDVAGPTTAEVTIAGANVCFTGCDGDHGSITGTAIAGTWTLSRVRPPTLFGAVCMYEGTFPYTGVTADLLENFCGAVVCSTTHIHITLTYSGTDWTLQAELQRAASCTCSGPFTSGIAVILAFFVDFIAMDACGDSSTGTLFTGCATRISAGGSCADGLNNAADRITSGGTYSITI